jgi:serine protease Do
MFPQDHFPTQDHNQDHTPPQASRAKRIRSLLLGSVFGVALAGAAVGQLVLLPSSSTPASAQISTDRSASQYSFADVVDRVRPAVVSVKVKVTQPQTMSFNGDGLGSEDMPPEMNKFLKRFFGNQMPNGRGGMPQNRRVTGQGSGFFISADGYIVTNNHVVENASEVDVQTEDGKNFTAKVIGTDQRTDLALLKIDGHGANFPWVKLAGNPPRVGDWVLAVGNPFGLGGTVTSGIVSARGRDLGAAGPDDFIQIDAAVNRGNSGGPTFNLAGEVIGVNTAIVSPSGGNVGIAFAIPSETVSHVVTSLKENGKVTRGYLGVNIQPVTPEIAEGLGIKETHGALVSDAQADTPAAKAGIKAGDVVTKVNGEQVKDARDLSRRISALAPGANVKITVLRDGKERDLSVSLAKLPDRRADNASPRGDDNADQTDLPRLGLKLAPANQVSGAGKEGVVVTDVDDSGPAAERGIRAGDVILEAGGKHVSSPSDLREALNIARKDGKSVVLLRLKSGESNRFVTLPVKQG